jgi:hypothetical protein
MTAIPHELLHHWTVISPLLSIRNEHEYDLAVERLNHLLVEVGTDEQHPLYTLLDTLGTLTHVYEEEHHPIPECSGADMLRFLSVDRVCETTRSHGSRPKPRPDRLSAGPSRSTRDTSDRKQKRGGAVDPPLAHRPARGHPHARSTKVRRRQQPSSPMWIGAPAVSAVPV